MLEYNRIDISERTDTNKTNTSKDCEICHYWYFLSKYFNYEPYLCNGFHNLLQKAMNFHDVAIVFIEVSDYRIDIWYLSKENEIGIMNSYKINEKSGLLYFFVLKIEMSEKTYYQRNRDVVLNRS